LSKGKKKMDPTGTSFAREKNKQTKNKGEQGLALHRMQPNHPFWSLKISYLTEADSTYNSYMYNTTMGWQITVDRWHYELIFRLFEKIINYGWGGG
jgi:hypothetical protein